MPTFSELDALSSKELHDRAVRAALKSLDVRFFFDLVAAIPAAEMVAGQEGEAQEDVVSLAKRLQDAIHADEGELADALRPLFIDYLMRQQEG